MKIQLSDHFTYRRLLQFTVSPILMMVCTSLYSIIDGFFVSNFVGKTAFAAVNLYMPLMMGLGAFDLWLVPGVRQLFQVHTELGSRNWRIAISLC